MDFALRAGAVAAFAVASALGLMFGIETELEERVVVFAGHQSDIAAAAAIAAARAAARDILLPPERQTAIAAIASLHQNSNFVDKHEKIAKGSARSWPAS